MRVTVLAGGVGSARFCAGLIRVVDPAELTIVVNVGDDDRMRGLHVSPDVDTVLYHLSGDCDWERGWGIREETYAVQERYVALAERAGELTADLQEWFTLGDRDIATNLLRTRMLEAGRTLSEATDAVRRGLGVGCRVLPATDETLRTVLHTEDGEALDFQGYFVRLRQAPTVRRVSFAGADSARPAPGVLEAVGEADVLIVPPSNPLLSIAPVLAVPGLREALTTTRARRLGVSPIVGGRAIKGPAGGLMSSMGHEVSSVGVARIYAGLLDTFVIDEVDVARMPDVEALGLNPVVCDTIMRSAEDAARLAKVVLGHAR